MIAVTRGAAGSPKASRVSSGVAAGDVMRCTQTWRARRLSVAAAATTTSRRLARARRRGCNRWGPVARQTVLCGGGAGRRDVQRRCQRQGSDEGGLLAVDPCGVIAADRRVVRPPPLIFLSPSHLLQLVSWSSVPCASSPSLFRPPP
jgi:hypothetical protein